MQSTDQLERLMDYTIFHIGMYVTLFSALAAFLQYKEKPPLMNFALGFSAVCFVVAGIGGGMIGSHIPEFETWDKFHSTSFGPWLAEKNGWTKFIRTYEEWAHLEHGAFWLGTVIVVITFVFTPPIPPAVEAANTAAATTQASEKAPARPDRNKFLRCTLPWILLGVAVAVILVLVVP